MVICMLTYFFFDFVDVLELDLAGLSLLLLSLSFLSFSLSLSGRSSAGLSLTPEACVATDSDRSASLSVGVMTALRSRTLIRSNAFFSSASAMVARSSAPCALSSVELERKCHQVGHYISTYSNSK